MNGKHVTTKWEYPHGYWPKVNPKLTADRIKIFSEVFPQMKKSDMDGWKATFNFDFTKVGVVVATRNTLRDLILTNRLLQSLRDSDFPHTYKLQMMIGYQNWNIRADGIDIMLKQDVDLVLSTDNDMVVPRLWWNQMLDIFRAEPTIGEVCPRVSTRNYSTSKYESYIWRSDGSQVPTEEAGYIFSGQLNDGFALMRADYLLQTGMRQPGRVEPGEWKGAWANRVVVRHDKVKPPVMLIEARAEDSQDIAGEINADFESAGPQK